MQGVSASLAIAVTAQIGKTFTISILPNGACNPGLSTTRGCCAVTTKKFEFDHSTIRLFDKFEIVTNSELQRFHALARG